MSAIKEWNRNTNLKLETTYNNDNKNTVKEERNSQIRKTNDKQRPSTQRFGMT